ncbi:uncharacterized protein LOC124888973 [Capsicum annuum]|uniref:uncharacterized protein LOC124888973 n=1 Tax=Capsicum annuum TaxID=4072 RepID=UPI001FB0E573|nr:uncharacterized protein LOC124888973 [Capsicum annuum]
MAIECPDIVESSRLTLAIVGNVESLAVVDMCGEDVIADCYNVVGKMKQKYKNKATLISVMHNYAIKHMFNFIAEGSDKQSYVFMCKSPECSWLFKASQHATIAFVAGIAAPKLLNHKRIITPSDIIEDIKGKIGLDIDCRKVWRAKERALKILRGSVVVVDDSHISGPYKGTFISASTLDGAAIARHILPLTYGVVDSENDSSWTWFFQQFKCAFEERDNMCVVSNRVESIIKAVNVVYPSIPHFACVWHLWNNVCTNYRKSKDKLTSKFFAMAKVYKLYDFDDLMERMMTSNNAECINSRLVEVRELPILDFLEQVRILFSVWNRKNRDRSSFLAKTHWEVRKSTTYIYGVYEEEEKYIVWLDNRTCNCGIFQLDEIPYAHTIAVSKSKHVKKMKSYCFDYYKKERLVKTYKMPLCPMPDRRD